MACRGDLAHGRCDCRRQRRCRGRRLPALLLGQHRQCRRCRAAAGWFGGSGHRGILPVASAGWHAARDVWCLGRYRQGLAWCPRGWRLGLLVRQAPQHDTTAPDRLDAVRGRGYAWRADSAAGRGLAEPRRRSLRHDHRRAADGQEGAGGRRGHHAHARDAAAAGHWQPGRSRRGAGDPGRHRGPARGGRSERLSGGCQPRVRWLPCFLAAVAGRPEGRHGTCRASGRSRPTWATGTEGRHGPGWVGRSRRAAGCAGASGCYRRNGRSGSGWAEG
ncbi:Hypothetical protein RMP42_05826 [Roseomonas mucosa]|nr:Hypothetical protein RMP42_05826 [Roseomonas mucosa]